MILKWYIFNVFTRQELNEARKIHTFKVSEVDAQVKANYESKLEATVIDLREQHSLELEQMREDLENEYTAKVCK